MSKPSIITRNHSFENKLNHVKRTKKCVFLSHEKDIRPSKILRTKEIDQAFESEDWAFFEILERQYIEKLGDELRFNPKLNTAYFYADIQ